MDNELKIFLQSFKELENLFQALNLPDPQVGQLKDTLSGIQKNAENLALYDSITHVLNARAGKWFLSNQQLKGIAKIDIYDLRQANKVFGAAAVDLELHKLAYQFMSMFTLEGGDFLHRSPGSDEFKIFSRWKTPQEIKALLINPYIDQEMTSLLPWDFGVGLTETEAENELQKQRKTYRPLVLRQTILESHSEIPARIKRSNGYQSWDEFHRLRETDRSDLRPEVSLHAGATNHWAGPDHQGYCGEHRHPGCFDRSTQRTWSQLVSGSQNGSKPGFDGHA
jgi:hypothetical protein